MQTNGEQNGALPEQLLREMEALAGFEVLPCSRTEFLDKKDITKLELGTPARRCMDAVFSQLPMLMTADSLTRAYVVRFPAGLPNSLVALEQGGFGSMIRGDMGRFVGTASFYPLQISAMFFAVFSTLSVATGQYFMSSIDGNIKRMRLSLDKILEFLYEDKKAELVSEISFLQYAYQNYRAIMVSEQQRLATLVSLQNARKVAVKDIEFYIGDLISTVNTKDGLPLDQLADKAVQIKECLELSMQLYVMGGLLEVYYAQNYDPAYIMSIEKDAAVYINKCEKRILNTFSVLYNRVNDHKDGLRKKFDKAPYEKLLREIIESLNHGEDSAMRQSLHEALSAPAKETRCYYCGDGSIYIQAG